MKRIIICFFLLTVNSILLIALDFKMVENNCCLRGGDSIHYDFITATVPQSSSASDQTWDFSNSRYLGQEKEVFFVGNDSNRIKMIDKDAILDFSQDKEHLLLKHLQTPLLNIDFGNSFEYLKFPFPLNDSLVCQIEGKGTYCSKNKLVLSGTCCTQTMAKGKLIMPYNDSLNNTLLIISQWQEGMFVILPSLRCSAQISHLQYFRMVFKSASLQRQAGNDYRQDFDCSGLPLGEYVLYIHVNDKAFSEKVHIK